MNAPILTVTLNPALDLSARISLMVPGPKLRLEQTAKEPGGGGVNVARVIHELGGAVSAWVALGGAAGVEHLGLLQAQGLQVSVFDCPGETRQNWAIMDRESQQYRLQLPGPHWDEMTGQSARAHIAAQPSDLVVLSGSQPPGLEAQFPQRLSAEIGAQRLVVDISGTALQNVLATSDLGLRALRLDQAEAETQAGTALRTPTESARYAENLRARGVADLVAIACGAKGNVLAAPEGRFHCIPPQVPVASKIGAGDSFTGAFTLALAQGRSARDALVAGTAAAAATVMSPGTALCRATDVISLQAGCKCVTLDA